ncbi:hypothetical protein ACH5RR_017365 [Cinchona calisaya]|uniref:Zinc finger CHCC-type domain-containing protein n=1 Tax=Cinchona calisaya TaxID=153742 RepID=A0ABD3A0Q4_9GENT
MATSLMRNLTGPAPYSFSSDFGCRFQRRQRRGEERDHRIPHGDTSKKSPMQLINEVPPIKVEGRIVACEGDSNPALGHPIEFICLDLDKPGVCKYCGLRYVQDHGSHHH